MGFFRAHRGQPIASSALMAPISLAFVAAIERFVGEQGVPLIPFAAARLASGYLAGARNEARSALDAAIALEDSAKRSAALVTMLPILAGLDDRAGLADVLSAAMANDTQAGGMYWRQRVMHAVASTLASMPSWDSTDASELVTQAIKHARPRGRDEMLGCIAAFAPVPTRLGVLQATWQALQRTEAVLVVEFPAAQ